MTKTRNLLHLRPDSLAAAGSTAAGARAGCGDLRHGSRPDRRRPAGRYSRSHRPGARGRTARDGHRRRRTLHCRRPAGPATTRSSFSLPSFETARWDGVAVADAESVTPGRRAAVRQLLRGRDRRRQQARHRPAGVRDERVAYLSAERLETDAIFTVEDAFDRTANAFTGTAGFGAYSIRGVNNAGLTGSFSAANALASVLLNQTALSPKSGDYLKPSLFDVASVEILRGPQSTLQGPQLADRLGADQLQQTGVRRLRGSGPLRRGRARHDAHLHHAERRAGRRRSRGAGHLREPPSGRRRHQRDPRRRRRAAHRRADGPLCSSACGPAPTTGWPST